MSSPTIQTPPLPDTDKAPRAAIIGAGFGGIALAIRLQSAGFETTLIDNRDRPGGRAYVYHDKGYTFDGGPTVITDPDSLRELWTLSGRDMADYVELLPVSPFYQLCWEDNDTFDYDNDIQRLEEQIRARSPEDVDGYRRFYDYTRDVYREGYEKLGTVPFLNFTDMVAAAPQLVRLQAFKSVYRRVSDFIQDPKLRMVFSFHSLLVGGNPFATSSIYTLIHALEREGGVWFAKGGTGALIAGMIRLFEDLGGTVRLSTEITSIETRDDRVTGVSDDSGWSLDVDLVASNADVVHTYKTLLADHPRGQSHGKALAGKRHSMSLFVIYFGLKAQHPDLKHHMVLFGPRYKDHIEEIFGADELADDFSLYLHAPSVTDETLAPEGCSAYYVLSPVPHLGHADIDWSVKGPEYRDKILAYLEERYIPNLRRDLDTVRILTPHDFRDEMNAHMGSAFSIEPILRQSAWFRPHNRDDQIDNLYIVGAGTHPGAGIPGVVGSAKATAGLCIEDFAPRLPKGGNA